MPIIDLQRRLQEAGRIRLGDKGPKGNPRKLETFRLTSSDKTLLDRVGRLYGGTVTPWTAQPGQYEITTEATALDVIVPPSTMAFSQWYETWSGGGCQKRCDGQWDQVRDAACSCNPDARECTPHTRLSVLLRDLPSIGVWRLETQGYYAATELLAAVELIQTIGNAGKMLPARLRLETRTVKRLGEGTKRFVVPILDVVATVPELLAAAGAPGGAPALGASTSTGIGAGSPALTPVPVDDLPAPPTASIADQVAKPRPRPARANAAAPIPSTGRRPRPSGQIDVADAAGREATSVDEPRDAASVPGPSAPSHDEDTINRAKAVARALREAGIVDGDRQRFLDAYSFGRYTSAKEIPEAEYAGVRDTIRRLKNGELLLESDAQGAPVLLNAKTRLVHTPVPDREVLDVEGDE